MSLRVLARSSGLYMVGNIAPHLGAFILVPVYVRALSQEDYGTLALLTTLSGLLAIIYRLGLDAALMRLHFDAEGPSQGRLYATVALFTMAAATVLTLVVVALGVPLFPYLFSGIAFVPLGALAVLIPFIGAIQYVPSVFLRATGQAGTFVAYNLSTFLIGSGTVVVLVVLVGMGPEGALIGQIAGAAATFAIAIYTVRRMTAWTFDRGWIRRALHLGLPLVPHGLSAWALRLADRWLIGLFIGLPAGLALEAIGAYSLGYAIGYAVTIIVVSFNSAWSPFFYRVGDRSWAPELHREATTVFIAGLTALAVGLGALAPEVIAVIGKPGYEEAANVLPVIAIASVFQGLYTMIATVVFQARRTAGLALVTLSSAVLNVALCAVLIPPLGIMGAAWATMASYVFFAAGTWVYARRWYPIRLDWIRLVLLIGGGALTVVASRTVMGAGLEAAPAAAHLAAGIVFTLAAAAVAYRPLRRLSRLVSAASSAPPAAVDDSDQAEIQTAPD